MSQSRVDSFLRRGLVTVCLGQSEGGTVRVRLTDTSGSREVASFRFPFAVVNGVKHYDPHALRFFWTLDRPELGGKSLREFLMCKAGVSLSSWGADLILLDENDFPIGGVNYPSACADQATQDWVQSIDPAWWHTTLGGAIQAPFQPLGILYYMGRVLPPTVWSQAKAVVPLVDYLYYLLTGEKCHDFTMQQSYGFPTNDAVGAVEEKLCAFLPPGILCPWPIMEADKLIQLAQERFGTFVVPFSHDSVYARIVGATAARQTVWTGSWVGTAVALGKQVLAPSETTLRLGLNFEGVDPRMVITNTGMFGPAYDYLVQQYERQLELPRGEGYARAAQFALQQAGLPLIDPSVLTGLTGEEAARVVYGALSRLEESCTPAMACATIIHTAVACVWKDLARQSEATGVRLAGSKVAVVGGWVNNRAFCELLRQRGLEVVTPPHAAHATEMGQAAEMLRLIMAEQGDVMTLEEVLRFMPG